MLKRGGRQFGRGFWGFIILSLIAGAGCEPKRISGTPVITVWHWMTDRKSAFEELARRYQARTGIKVNFELYAPSDQYAQKVRAAAQGQTLPDIYGILGEKRDFASFVKAGLVLNLEPYMLENGGVWKNSFYANALAVNEFEAGNVYGAAAGIYAAPLDIMTIQMLYNKKLMQQLGWNADKPPARLQELIDMGPKIKAANLLGLVSGWSELWLIDCLVSNYAFNIMGKDKVLATFRGEVPYTDADWVKVLGVFKALREAGILSTNLLTMVNKTAEQLFANEKAVFAFNGSWCVNVYKGMNPDLDYGVIPPPRAQDTFPMSIWGGAGSSFMVNAQAKNTAEAVNFLKWLTAKEQQAYMSETTNNIPANKDSQVNIPQGLRSFAKAIDSSTHPNIWGVSEFPAVIEAWDKGIQSIILGEKTPEQVAREVQKIKERELAKKR
jgi:ABC-type glycerol-3-phosphate transport system substrate-binding protein